MNQMQMQSPPLTKINKVLIIILVGCFILNTATKGALSQYLSLSLMGIKSGLIYQILSYPFIANGFMGVLFDGLIIWFIGSELEMKWGQKFYLTFLGLSVTFAAAVYLGLAIFFKAYPLVGMSSICYSLLMGYALVYKERQLTFMFLFPMKAMYFCLLLAAILLYQALASGQGVSAWASLAAMAHAYAFLQWKSYKARGGSLDAMRNKVHKEKMKRSLYIVPNEEEKEKADKNKPKYWQ